MKRNRDREGNLVKKKPFLAAQKKLIYDVLVGNKRHRLNPLMTTAYWETKPACS